MDWPATPDLAAAVTTRIAAEPRGRRNVAAASSAAPARVRRRLAARVAYVAAALVVLVGGTLAVSPDARSTVLRWLGLESVEIKREPLPPGIGRELDLGEPIALPRGTKLSRRRWASPTPSTPRRCPTARRRPRSCTPGRR